MSSQNILGFSTVMTVKMLLYIKDSQKLNKNNNKNPKGHIAHIKFKSINTFEQSYVVKEKENPLSSFWGLKSPL